MEIICHRFLVRLHFFKIELLHQLHLCLQKRKRIRAKRTPAESKLALKVSSTHSIYCTNYAFALVTSPHSADNIALEKKILYIKIYRIVDNDYQEEACLEVLEDMRQCCLKFQQSNSLCCSGINLEKSYLTDDKKSLDNSRNYLPKV